MKRVLFFLVLVLNGVIFSCKDAQETTDIQVVTPEEMQQISETEGVQLVDVRTPEEYDEGYIEGFQNIDYYSDTFIEDIEKLDKTKPVIVYCRSGRRSSDCAKQLKDKGFVKIYDLDGGIEKWKFKGFEVKTKS